MKGNKLYVGNLNYATTSEKLQGLFATYGTVTSVKVIEGKGFGFVEMSSQAEAENAQKALNGTEFEGRTIKVDEARPPEERPRRNFGGDRRY